MITGWGPRDSQRSAENDLEVSNDYRAKGVLGVTQVSSSNLEVHSMILEPWQLSARFTEARQHQKIEGNGSRATEDSERADG